MSKWDKLLQKIKTLSGDLRYEELKKVLESFGYTAKETSGGSSHITFRKSGCPPITVPRHSTIKRVYVEMVKEIIEKEESNENS